MATLPPHSITCQQVNPESTLMSLKNARVGVAEARLRLLRLRGCVRANKTQRTIDRLVEGMDVCLSVLEQIPSGGIPLAGSQ
jgi:hypothetical protein